LRLVSAIAPSASRTWKRDRRRARPGELEPSTATVASLDRDDGEGGDAKHGAIVAW
jgi:hypothetical protein